MRLATAALIPLATIPTGTDQSPEAALHTMDRAIAENELVELRQESKRVKRKKASNS